MNDLIFLLSEAKRALVSGDEANAIKMLKEHLLEPKDKIKVALDIDGVIDENREFFSKLSQNPEFDISIVTGRDPKNHTSTVLFLENCKISYNDIHYADTWTDKARICQELGVKVFIEDQDEYIKHLPEGILVLKSRNGGNYNFRRSSWL